jgi:hypothetical protein
MSTVITTRLFPVAPPPRALTRANPPITTLSARPSLGITPSMPGQFTLLCSRRVAELVGLWSGFPKSLLWEVSFAVKVNVNGGKVRGAMALVCLP